MRGLTLVISTLVVLGNLGCGGDNGGPSASITEDPLPDGTTAAEPHDGPIWSGSYTDTATGAEWSWCLDLMPTDVALGEPGEGLAPSVELDGQDIKVSLALNDDFLVFIAPFPSEAVTEGAPEDQHPSLSGTWTGDSGRMGTWEAEPSLEDSTTSRDCR